MDLGVLPPAQTITEFRAHLESQCKKLVLAINQGNVDDAETVAIMLARARTAVQLKKKTELDDSLCCDRHRVGSSVQYFSQQSQRWVQAFVNGFDDVLGTYKLDIHPAAPPERVRAIPTSLNSVDEPQHSEGPPDPLQYSSLNGLVPQFEEGSIVEYHSRTHSAWVPALVHGYNVTLGAYILNIQPIAFPDKVRAIDPEKLRLLKSGMDPTTTVHGDSPSEVKFDHAAVRIKSHASAEVRVYESDPPVIPVFSPQLRCGEIPAIECDNATGGLDHCAVFWSEMHARPQAAAPEEFPLCDGLSGIDAPVIQKPEEPSSIPRKQCNMCSVEVPLSKLMGPICDHVFCKPCICEHVLSSDFLRQSVKCPCCEEGLHPTLVRHIVGEKIYTERQAVMAAEDEDFARHINFEWQNAQAEEMNAPAEGMDAPAEGMNAPALEMNAPAERMNAPAEGMHSPAEGLSAPEEGRNAQEEGRNTRHASEQGSWMHNALVPAVGRVFGLWGSQENEPFPNRNPFARAPRNKEAVNKEQQEECGLCHMMFCRAKMVGPGCDHLFCNPCYTEHICQSDFVINRVLCPGLGCGTVIEQKEIEHLLGREEIELQRCKASERAAQALQEQFAREELEARALFLQQHQVKCPLCLENGPKDGAIELDCNHQLCANCFREYLNAKIVEALVDEDELVCPIPNCKTTITVAQVEGATVGTPLWEKFLQFRMNQWKPAGVDEKIVQCPSAECEMFVVPAGVESVTCPTCRKEFCPNCGLEHKGVSCEAFRKWREDNAQVDQHFEQLMVNQQWRRCPECGMPSERESGCNFIQCRSTQCRKRTYWCYVCGKKLRQQDHYSHYPKGPYEDECHTPEAQRLKIEIKQPTQRAEGSAAEGVEVPAIFEAFRGWFGIEQRDLGRD